MKRNVHYLVISQMIMMVKTILRRRIHILIMTTTLMKITVCVKFCKTMQH